MKTTAAVLLFALMLATAATAQDHPYLSSGRAFVGGGISLGLGGNVPNNADPAIDQENRRFSGSLSPTYGWFYNDRWAAGVSLTVGYVRDRREATGTNTVEENLSRQLTVGITPFLRCYLPLTERFGAFVQPELSYRHQTLTISQERIDAIRPDANSYSETANRRHIGSLGVRGGLYYFITEHFTVETNLGQLAFTLNTGINKSTTADNQVNSTAKSTEYDAQLNQINQLSLDQIFILNYYF